HIQHKRFLGTTRWATWSLETTTCLPNSDVATLSVRGTPTRVDAGLRQALTFMQDSRNRPRARVAPTAQSLAATSMPQQYLPRTPPYSGWARNLTSPCPVQPRLVRRRIQRDLTVVRRRIQSDLGDTRRRFPCNPRLVHRHIQRDRAATCLRIQSDHGAIRPSHPEQSGATRQSIPVAASTSVRSEVTTAPSKLQRRLQLIVRPIIKSTVGQRESSGETLDDFVAKWLIV
ncbi:hypothetical protein L914_10246, partial [Phytophthora nicotianae]